jgi:hypothetical protein
MAFSNEKINLEAALYFQTCETSVVGSDVSCSMIIPEMEQVELNLKGESDYLSDSYVVEQVFEKSIYRAEVTVTKWSFEGNNPTYAVNVSMGSKKVHDIRPISMKQIFRVTGTDPKNFEEATASGAEVQANRKTTIPMFVVNFQ